MKRYKIAVIPGDGIGQEVIPEGVKILEEIAGKYNVEFEWEEFDWSCQYYAENGTMMPEDGLEQISSHNAIFLGAVGYPGVPDHISLWGLLIPIRRSFNQYVNVRPVRLMEGLDCPLKNKVPQDIDMVIVRENNEGEYSEIGGKIYANTSQEMVIQESVFTQKGVDRILKYAFELAGTRRGKVTSATKSNGIVHTMPYWDSRFEMIKKGYPHVTTDQFHIDILTAHFVLHPEWFDVVVASNLFGDILSDLAPAVAGTIGIAASANLNPEGEYPSMFEPVHGSAPDIAGKGIANPIATLWSAAMMMDHLGHPEISRVILDAIGSAVREKVALTPDMGGKATTRECADAICQMLD